MAADPEDLDTLNLGGEVLWSSRGSVVSAADRSLRPVQISLTDSLLTARPESGGGGWTLPLTRLEAVWWTSRDAEVVLYDSQGEVDLQLRMGGRSGYGGRDIMLGALVATMGALAAGMEAEVTDEDPRGGPGGGTQLTFDQ